MLLSRRVVFGCATAAPEISGAKEAEVMAELGSLPNPHRPQMLALAQRDGLSCGQ
ncbi:MAG: hypothetical protein R3C56_20585 [Pirellulaceae bacterium]